MSRRRAIHSSGIQRQQTGAVWLPSVSGHISSVRFLCVFFALLFSLGLGREALAASIVDYQHRLSRRFPKVLRKETKFIVVHSTESSLPSALRTLSRGKVWHGRYVTRGGHAHYLIARNGTIYRILDPRYWANHAGVSMWNGLEELSDYSLGIELEGYHNVPFSEAQYQSLKWLLGILKKRYNIADRDVVEHYRVAYSAPNRFHSSNLRGRKSDPGVDNFDRSRAGLQDEYPEDPDVIAGRIVGSPTLMRAGGHPIIEVEEDEADPETLPAEAPDFISSARTAWQIAGPQYKATTTLYQFPDGLTQRGDQIQDWSNIPAGTEVQLNVAEEGVQVEKEVRVVNAERMEVVVPEITSSRSPWKVANALYNSSNTFYVYPDGTFRSGNTISNWSEVPTGTKVLIAYRKISSPKTDSRLGEDLEAIYLSPSTIYLLQDLSFKSGDQIENFTIVPTRTSVFAKLD